jgi:hypothetical protein
MGKFVAFVLILQNNLPISKELKDSTRRLLVGPIEIEWIPSKWRWRVKGIHRSWRPGSAGTGLIRYSTSQYPKNYFFIRLSRSFVSKPFSRHRCEVPSCLVSNGAQCGIQASVHRLTVQSLYLQLD